LSLPATSNIITPDGYAALGDNERGWLQDDTVGAIGPFTDFECQGTHIEYDTFGNPKTVLNVSWDHAIHNSLEFGSETPHQLGWYLTVLATEYELLKRNQKYDEAERTLEEIFLALQAYRRLDITANCLVKKRYDEITEGFEIEMCQMQVGFGQVIDPCLCPTKYNVGPCSDGEEHLDIPTKPNCPWEPDLSGYSGFFIREDAVQSLDNLHDDSEDRWNVDMVNSAFTMSQSPPCTSSFSQTCYLYREGRFLSSDQMFTIMMGLAMVKRFVPEGATVTTCNGDVFHPLEIAQNIAKGMVELPQNSTRHIFWPGSDNRDCCHKSIKFGQCNGGNFQTLYAGLEYMYNYIDPENKHKIEAWDRAKWSLLMQTTLFPDYNANGNFALEAMTFANDWRDLDNLKAIQLINGSIAGEKEIFLLMNDVVFPEYPHNVNDQGHRDIFKQMLCDAPCSGPCVRPVNYEDHDSTWPEFDCSNTPGWMGQRWEGPRHSALDWAPTETYRARQFNGLDYMALYNLYMLKYPEEQTPFTNSNSYHNGDEHLLGESQIMGPSHLCPYGEGTYTLKPNYPSSVIQGLTWSATDHFSLSTTTGNPTTATFGAPSMPGYPTIFADFEEIRQIQQYEGGLPGEVIQVLPLVVQSYGTADDVCQFSYSKPIKFANLPYSISTEPDHCTNQYWFHAIGLPALAYNWEISAVADDPNLQPLWFLGSGQNFLIDHPHPRVPGNKGTFFINLAVATTCGTFEGNFTARYQCVPSGYSVRVDPNPASTEISVSIVKNDLSPYYITDPNGVQILITPASGGTHSINTRIYNNGQTIPISTLPNGIYSVYSTPSDVEEQLSTTLVIMR
jgi:hypothetical protein